MKEEREEEERERKEKRGNEKREVRKRKRWREEGEKGTKINTHYWYERNRKSKGQAYLDAFLCSSFIFSRRRRTRVVRCWSIRSPETATPVCRGYIGVGSSSISLEESRTSSGETWFQPRLVDWNGGTDSRCFRMRLCEMEHIVEGVTIEHLSEIGHQTYSRSFCLALAWMVRIVCSPHCATSSSTAPMAQLIARRTWLICEERTLYSHSFRSHLSLSNYIKTIAIQSPCVCVHAYACVHVVHVHVCILV